MNAAQLAKSREEYPNPDPFFPEPDVALSDEELRGMEHALEKISKIATRPFESGVYGEVAHYCKKEASLVLMATSKPVAAMHRKCEIGEWLINCINDGNSDSFRWIARFIDAYHKEGKKLPSEVSLESLGIKRTKGRPSKLQSFDSSLSLFAMAAHESVVAALQLQRKPSVGVIRVRMNTLRKKRDLSEISSAEFSRCVTYFNLNDLLHGEKPGPVKGTAQLNRNKRAR